MINSSWDCFLFQELYYKYMFFYEHHKELSMHKILKLLFFCFVQVFNLFVRIWRVGSQVKQLWIYGHICHICCIDFWMENKSMYPFTKVDPFHHLKVLPFYQCSPWSLHRLALLGFLSTNCYLYPHVIRFPCTTTKGGKKHIVKFWINKDKNQFKHLLKPWQVTRQQVHPII
jgi:hypothetical protein